MFLVAKAIWQFVTKTDDPNVVCFVIKTEERRNNSTKFASELERIRR